MVLACREILRRSSRVLVAALILLLHNIIKCRDKHRIIKCRDKWVIIISRYSTFVLAFGVLIIYVST
ncbi:unnamed protein product [Trifolium pratense]|uniref:Uncharacterized protein n=1 Tax=Trifolium pratense TaxID=57577 RepID=A0ACB0K7K8_TRIPR|nr:unnamed protein product [Trifolium pratense]